MKFFSFLTAAGLAVTALASPLNVKRDEAGRVAAAYAVFEKLYSDVQVYTAQINSTTSSVDLDNPVEVASATLAVQGFLGQITTLVNGATPELDSIAEEIPAERRALAERQLPGDLAGLIANLILDISGALNNIVNTLGLGAILGSLGLGPLLVSLSGLLIALRNLLDQVLILVKNLVDQLLTGLATGLIGIFP